MSQAQMSCFWLTRTARLTAPGVRGKKMPTATSQHFAPATSKIGEELIITGNVTSKGEIHIDGTVQGEILCHSLTIGDKSQIEGSVVAEEVVIRGRLVGSVHASKVTLHSRCHVEGDVFHRGLTMEQGAVFDGKSGPWDDRD